MFRLRSSVEEEYLGDVRCYAHEPSGLTVLVARNGDPGRLMGVAVTTAAADAKGAPHVLEHLLLAGSANYSSEDPVADMTATSPEVYGNAFTRPDHTCFVAGSRDAGSFADITDVYLDGIFRPLLRLDGFHQHVGRHEGDVFVPGIAASEIVNSDGLPDLALTGAIRQGLFPRHNYRYPVRGLIEAMRTLTLAEVRRYYDAYFRPDAMLVFLYGDIDPEPLLAKLDALAADRPIGAPAVAPIPRATKPVLAEARYATDDETAGGLAAIGWATRATSMMDRIRCQLLEQYLRAAAAPLIAEAVAHDVRGAGITTVGLIRYLSLPVFQVLARGADGPDDRRRLAAAVGDTLARTVDAGIPAEAAATALNRLEFGFAENEVGAESPPPPGLAWFLRVLPAWRFRAELIGALRPHRCLARIAADLAAGTPVIESAITEFLLGNPHQAWVYAAPRRRSPPSGISPRPPANRTLGHARTSPPKIVPVPSRDHSTVTVEDGLRVLGCASPSSIAYLDIAFDLRCLPAQLLPIAPVLAAGLVEIAGDARIDRYTGGIAPHVAAVPGVGPFLVLRGKALGRHAGVLAELMAEIISGPPADRAAFTALVRRERRRLLALRTNRPGGLVIRTHRRTACGAADELLAGFAQLHRLAALESACHTGWDAVREALAQALELIRSPSRVTVSWHVPVRTQRPTAAIAAALEGAPVVDQVLRPPGEAGDEIFVADTPWNATATGVALDEVHGTHLVCAEMLNRHLWEERRLGGGAYAAACVLDRASGALGMYTHRDPDPAASVACLRRAGRHLAGTDLDQATLRRHVAGAAGRLVSPGDVAAETLSRLLRVLRAEDAEMTMKLREQTLATTVRDCRAFGESLETILADSVTVALTSDPEQVRRLGRVLPHSTVKAV